MSCINPKCNSDIELIRPNVYRCTVCGQVFTKDQYEAYLTIKEFWKRGGEED